MQQAIFPITILLKNGKLQVISTVTPTETQSLLRRVLEKLEVPTQDLNYEQEKAEGEDGEQNTLFQVIESIQADALCVLSNENDFLFLLVEEVDANEAENLRHLMREKLIEHMRSVPE